MRRKGPRRDVEKERFWREVIRRQRRSGQSVRGFCRNEALSEPSFYAWRRELMQRTGKRRIERPHGQPTGRQTRRPAFVAVRLAAGVMPMTAGAIELALPNGAVLRLPGSIEPATVAAFVNAWEQGRC